MKNSELQENHKKKQQAISNKKNKENAEQEYEENIIRIRNSNARIPAIAAEAKEMGLTYGDYMARLRG